MSKDSEKKKGLKTLDRPALKGLLKKLKEKRQEALEGKDYLQLKRIRARYRRVNRRLRRLPAPVKA